jgi:very-short-patch-repair endonuclease
LPYNPDLNDRAKELRKNMTQAEKKLWYQCLNNIFIPLNKGEDFLQENQGDSSKEELKENQKNSSKKKLKILRQKIIDNYIVDFYVPDLKIAIEID